MYYDMHTNEVVELISIENIQDIPCCIFVLNKVECILPKEAFDRMYKKALFSVNDNITNCDEVFTVTSIIDGGYVLNGEFTISFSNECDYLLIQSYEEVRETIRETIKDELCTFLKSLTMQHLYRG